MRHITKLSDVVDWRMCIGCGACAYICPTSSVHLVDYYSEGIRPVVQTDSCGDCQECLNICPAVQSDYRSTHSDHSTTKNWGPITGLWEGYASDPEIRFKGSSGGALTAIALYCLDRLQMHGVLHIAQHPEEPLRNKTRLSRSRAELMETTGSRYSPASVCNGLGLVESAPSPCVVIGKPAEISAVKNCCKVRPELEKNVALTLSFFCAETPATQGTTELLMRMGIKPEELGGLRFRGHGWPGHFAPTKKGAEEPCEKMTYRESWAFLQAYRPWSVQLWPDSSGELADISCGDPWYEAPDGKNPGFSLIVARTKRGAEIIEGAMAAGYLLLKPAENWKLVKSQSGLLSKKGSIWGRRLAMRLFGLPVTRFEGLDLRYCWMQLPKKEKLRAVAGTIRRIITRKLFQPLKLDERHGTRIARVAATTVNNRDVSPVNLSSRHTI